MVTVIKAGGAVLKDETAKTQVAQQVAAASHQGRVIFVHGGGPQLDAACAVAGITPQRVNGRRITDDKTLKLAVASWRGHASVAWVAALSRQGVKGIGMCGLDGGILRAIRRSPEPIDFGSVGDLVGGGYCRAQRAA